LATLLHLVSDGARFITRQTIVIDGRKYFLGWDCRGHPIGRL
jgi:hypothetical protein